MIRDRPDDASQRLDGRDDAGFFLGLAGGGWLGGMVISALVAQAISGLAGWQLRTVSGLGGPVGQLAARAAGGTIAAPPPLLAQLLFNIPLWLAFVAATVVAARRDSTLAMRLRPGWVPRDLVVGVVAGLASQFGLLLVIYQVFLRWFIDPNRVDDAARSLTDQIQGPLDLVALLFLVGLVAPVVEEIFFRGLVYRGFEELAGRGVAIVASGFVFGAVHLQLVQFAGLFAFGVVLAGLVASTGRLGASIWAHISFNVATVVVLGVAAL